MTNAIKILDTGLYSVDDTSVTSGEAQAPGDDGVAGDALTLRGAEVTMGIDTMLSADSAVLAKKDSSDTEYYVFGQADNTGVELPTWSVRGYCNRATEADMITLGRLIFFCKTKGYKELYSSDSDDFHDIIAYSHYGENEHNGDTAKVTKINVRIKSLSVQQSADKKGFTYTLNLVETN
jgi:hypothetical protein